MIKPTMLVTAAAGKTGIPTVTQLIEQGYPVRAMVRRSDQRSERLRQLGAEVVVGSLDDIVDVRQALAGVQRAYYCPPFSRDPLAASVTFAVAAEEHHLEMVTVMSQWLADPTGPSLQTRQQWLGDRAFRWMPTVGTVIVNPGWFADNYVVGTLDVVAQQGAFALPLGDGLNAPPSNEDIARVVVGTLTNPAPHLGQTYRPTGPRLLDPPEIADIIGRALGRRVRYQPTTLTLISKLARSVGVPDLQIEPLLYYIQEYQRNAFGIGAPTQAVQEVGGRAPEDFETIVRRYVATTPYTAQNLGNTARIWRKLVKALRTPALNLEQYAQEADLPQIHHIQFAGDSPDWRATHGAAAAEGSVMVQPSV